MMFESYHERLMKADNSGEFKITSPTAILVVESDIIYYLEWSILRQNKYNVGIYYEVQVPIKGDPRGLLSVYRGWYGNKILNVEYNYGLDPVRLYSYFGTIRKCFRKQQEDNIFEYRVFE